MAFIVRGSIIVALASDRLRGSRRRPRQSTLSAPSYDLHWIQEVVMSGVGSRGEGASQQLARLFERSQGVAVSREEVRAVARQLDYMKRLRRNGGARDILDSKGIALLWGRGDRSLIAQLGLDGVGDTDFISYTPADDAEYRLITANGHAELGRPPTGKSSAAARRSRGKSTLRRCRGRAGPRTHPRSRRAHPTITKVT